MIDRLTPVTLAFGMLVAASLATGAAPALHNVYRAQQAHTNAAETAASGRFGPRSPRFRKTEDLTHRILRRDGAVVEGDDFATPTRRGWVAVQPAASFAEVFRQYRAGDAERAISIVAGWTPRQVEQQVKLPPGQDDLWVKAAFALFHAEAAVHGSKAWRILQDRMVSLFDALYEEAKASGDLKVKTFCRDWFVIALTRSRNVFDDVRRRMPEDPLVQLALGAYAEYFMPNVDPVPSGYGRGDWPVVLTTSHGQFGASASDAEGALRQALVEDPHLVEARVRLGHVLWLLDRGEEAERELRQAESEASTVGDASMGYLAGLFLGRLYEEAKRTEAATQAYQDAIRVYPDGQVARLALGRLLVATGRESDGWDAAAHVLSHPMPTLDPWVVYPKGRPWLEVSARFRALRSQVRQ